MRKTLLAVDDSLTMRKVIEMTFAGEDLRVVTVANAAEALAACRRERPDAVLADVSLDGPSGYELCRSVKDEISGVPVIILSSKQNPYDPARGQAAGADENLEKPYDTGKAIELVRRVLEQGRSMAPSPIVAVSTTGAPAAPRAPMFSAPAQPPLPGAVGSARPQVAMPPRAPYPTVPGISSPPTPPAYVSSSGQAATVVPKPAAPTPYPALQSIPTRPGGEEATYDATASARAHALHRQVTLRLSSDAPPSTEVHHGTLAELAQLTSNGGPAEAPVGAISVELSGRLEEIGLTPAQVDAVMALSRDVVEKVVWEVVPIIAETLVKEEIARLMRET